MQFKEVSFPPILDKTFVPQNLELIPPTNSELPIEQQHYLLAIPWKETYLKLIPEAYQAFFLHVLPFLHVRTTDVHTATSVGYLPELLSMFPEGTYNQRVIAISLILHDSGWSQLTEQEVANSLGVTGLALTATAMGPKEKHAVEGEKLARKLLSEFAFEPALTTEEIELICKGVLYHDRPEAVAGSDQPMPLEIQILVDLDHLWSFTQENFWQDTARKGVAPKTYLENLTKDLDSYFVTPQGKALARKKLAERATEVAELEQLLAHMAHS